MAAAGVARAAFHDISHILVFLHIGGPEVHEGQEAVRAEERHRSLQFHTSVA